ncbi:MAG: helix-turn-helix domain-containing protein [Propionicimonas sp.]|nr:helix-turn-helix domain-containing protein [Propionicimonas sp.]
MTTPDLVSDPSRIRALAHPLRLALLDLLGDEREVTATRAAEVTGESVASCSFHLRMLAKYGFAERAEAHGREKPWRATSRHGHSFSPEPGDPGAVQAVGDVAGLLLTREFERIRTFLAGATQESEEWVLASTVARSSFWATREELADLSDEVGRLADRFAGRWDDPALRPPDSRPARLLAVVNPEPRTAGTEQE